MDLEAYDESAVDRTEHKTNEEILQMVVTETEIMDTVRSRQKRWLLARTHPIPET